MIEPSERELNLCAGIAAFDAMYAEIEDDLREVAVRILRDAHEVAEFMLDCRNELLTRVHNFDPRRAAFRAWADRMVSNMCQDIRDQLCWEIPLEDIEDQPERVDSIEAVEVRVDYEMAVAKLPPMQKKCWGLRQEGYAHSEIARMLGITEDAAKKNTQRAKVKIAYGMSL